MANIAMSYRNRDICLHGPTVIFSPLTRSVAVFGLTNRLVPVARVNIPVLDGGDQGQANGDAAPETLELPVEGKGGAERNGQRNDIVREQIGVAAKVLLADTAEETMRHGRHGVKNLHNGHHYMYFSGISSWLSAKNGTRNNKVLQ
jgi:hypothetical protein